MVEAGSACAGARSATMGNVGFVSLHRGPLRRRLARVAWFLVASTALACGHEWDPFDPRLGEPAGTASSGATGGGGASSSSGPSSSSAGAATPSGGSGGAGAGTASSAGGAPTTCGNGTIESTEECDDGNDTTGDGCASCTVECSGAGEVEDPATHHCYRFTASIAWDAAVTECAAWGGHLSSITSEAELDFVRLHIQQRTWIGGNELRNERTWAWDNGEPWSFAPWNDGEPNDGGGNAGGGPPYDEDCVELYDNPSDRAPYGFADFNCPEPHVSLCERWPAGTLP